MEGVGGSRGGYGDNTLYSYVNSKRYHFLLELRKIKIKAVWYSRTDCIETHLHLGPQVVHFEY